MPNLLAQIVLYSWPLVTWYLFRRLSLTQALVSTILLGYLFIPEWVGFDPPLLPPINKSLMPSLCAAVAVWVIQRKETALVRRTILRDETTADPASGPAAGARPRRNMGKAAHPRITRVVPMILLVLLLAPVLTWASNQDPLIYGPRFLRGVALYDIGSMVMDLVAVFLPFWLARKYLGTREAQLDLLRIFALCALAYSFMVVWEARMSPRLNVYLYGFFADDWVQHVRGGGFRPIVFLKHGLRVGIFLSMAALAAAVLARANTDGRRKQWLMLSGWLVVCLVVSHNLGATAITLLLLPVILIAPTRVQFLLGMVISVVVLVYPMARGGGLIPADRILAYVQGYNADRAQSLEFRLVNEDILLAKANQKPTAGWGTWGRNRVFDPVTGDSESITDGSWIIVIGVYGWIGYLGQFGLLCLPGILSALRYRRYRLDSLDAGIIIVLCANIIDLIPNSSMVPVLWVMAGMSWGRLELAGRTLVEERLHAGPPGRARRGGGSDRPIADHPVPDRSAPERQPPSRQRPGPKTPAYSAKVTPSKT